jgi:hypothetical protein
MQLKKEEEKLRLLKEELKLKETGKKNNNDKE